MSEALSTETPAPEAAAPETPAPSAEVNDGSAGAVVAAERFNGLMSKYQTEKSEWETRQRAMEADLESLRQATKEQAEVPDNSDLQAEVAALRDLLVSREADNAKKAALDKYPEAKPFADLIVGDTAADIEAVAAQIAERVKLVTGDPETPVEPAVETPSGEVTPTVPAVETPAMPEHGSGVSVSPETASLHDAKEAAIAAGDFEAFLNAQWAIQEAEVQTA